MTQREQLGLRIPDSVKERYEQKIEEIYGTTRPWAGTELERELRWQFGMDHIGTTGAAPAPDSPGEKISTVAVPDGPTSVANYRIHPDVRSRLMKFASRSNYSSAGNFVAKILMTKIEDNSESDASYSGIKEKRTATIAAELEEMNQWTLDDFNEAVAKADGISPGEHATEEYLPRVLDWLDYTWHPNNPELFVDSITTGPGPRDPREKPYYLMDDDDLRDALAVAALDGKAVGDHGLLRLNVDEARDQINGKPSTQKLTTSMATVSDYYEPYRVRGSGSGTMLLVNIKDEWPDDDEHLDLLEVAGVFDDEQDTADVNLGKIDQEMDMITDEGYYDA